MFPASPAPAERRRLPARPAEPAPADISTISPNRSLSRSALDKSSLLSVSNEGIRWGQEQDGHQLVVQGVPVVNFRIPHHLARVDIVFVRAVDAHDVRGRMPADSPACCAG